MSDNHIVWRMTANFEDDDSVDGMHWGIWSSPENAQRAAEEVLGDIDWETDDDSGRGKRVWMAWPRQPVFWSKRGRKVVFVYISEHEIDEQLYKRHPLRTRYEQARINDPTD